MAEKVKTGIHVEGFICREDGAPMDPELFDRVVRKLSSEARRMGCRIHGTWRVGRPPGLEDKLGMASPRIDILQDLPDAPVEPVEGVEEVPSG